MSKLFKYAFSDLYDISSGISSTKDQAGHGTPFASFRTVFNNIFLPDKLPDLMEVTEEMKSLAEEILGSLCAVQEFLQGSGI